MKRFLFAFATAVLLVAMPKLRVSAQVTTEVIQGLTCTYDDETKTLTITGEGSLEGGRGEDNNLKSPLSQYRKEVEKICMKDVTLVGSAYAGFYGFTSLKEITFENIDTSQATNMGLMFGACSALKSLDLRGFDTSQVTDMSGMFEECYSLNRLDISGFDTSQVTRMRSMFGSCSALTSLDISNFNTANVTEMVGMFQQCSSLKSLDLSSFNTANVTDMWAMFWNCSSLSSLDASGFNTAKVTDMKSMFEGCSSLSNLDLSDFDTTLVTNMDCLFKGCSSLSSLDLSNFNTEKVTNMRSMFEGCSSLSSLDISSFNTSEVSLMIGMFSGCSSLTGLDLGSFDTTKVSNGYAMNAMLNKCNKLATIRTPQKIGEFEIDLPDNYMDEQGNEYTKLTAADCGKLLTKEPDYKFTIPVEQAGTKYASYQGMNFYVDGNGQKRCYREDGRPLVNAFRCDGTYTYYFQLDGTCMTDRLSYHPDGIHVIYFDHEGHEVFSNFANVKKTISGEAVDDYCFFNVFGYLYVDVVTFDQTGTKLYYANEYGVMNRNAWFRFSDSVKWADGTPFDKAGGEYGYATEDGSLMINTETTDWEGRPCRLQGNGVALY